MARNRQGISGVTVGNLISNSRDDLPIIYSQDIQGGLTSVATATERLQITAQRLQQGCIVYQESDDTYHRFLDTEGVANTPLARDAAGNFTNANAAMDNVTNETSWAEVAFNASEPAIIDNAGTAQFAPGVDPAQVRSLIMTGEDNIVRVQPVIAMGTITRALLAPLDAGTPRTTPINITHNSTNVATITGEFFLDGATPRRRNSN